MRTVALANEYLPKLSVVAAGVVLLSLVLYAVFLTLALNHAAKQAGLEKDIRTASLAVASLQQEYLAQTKSLTLPQARAMGFVEPVAVATVYASAGALSLAPAAGR